MTQRTARRRRPIRDALQLRVAPHAIALMLRGLRLTWRMRAHQRETIERFAANDQRFLLVVWHAHLLGAFYAYVGPRWSFMISRHRDGEMIAKVGELFGYHTVRGSTTEGSVAALREAVRAGRAGSDLGLTPDGPRGPARVVQPGCVALAKLLSIPIVPLACGASREWRARSWDRFSIPKPGADLLLAYGSPIWLESDETIEQGVARVQRGLDETSAFAQSHAADRTIGRAL